MSPGRVTMVSICPWSYLEAYRSEQACVNAIWLKIVWVICHGLVQFICYASNSTVWQVGISVLFIRRKEFVGKIWLSQKFGHIECLKLGLGAIGKRVNENTGSRRRWIRTFLMIETFGKMVDYKGKKKYQRLNVWNLGRQWYYWQ